MIGRTLGHYEILEEISRGGMGVVYRARDLNLDREVALKVLPDELTHDTTRRERMLQEARAASALEHPHIAVIHGVGEADGVTYIAMELIRGEKLSDIIARGSLQVRRALDLAIEIAEGLTRAHETGVVHRDLKPANVMVTDEGHVKLIDFGLAKLLPASAPSSEGETVTDDRLRTAPGQVLGTVAYMSPEQARGTPLDHRTDIFSFGDLLFELLTGNRPFAGPTEADTLQAILSQPIPPLPARPGLPSEVASGLERVIAKCVEKDPDERYQTIKDVVVDLRAARRHLESSTAASVAAVPAESDARDPTASRRPVVLAGLAAVVVTAGALALWLPWNRGGTAIATNGKPALAVLYFENQTGDESLDWMRTGLADMMVTDLSQDVNFEVLGTDRLYQILDDLNRAEDRVVSADVVEQVADRAGVDRVLVGSYIKAGDTIRINARLQDVDSGRIVTSERVEGPGESSLFSLVDELTRRIRSQMARIVRGPGMLLEQPGVEEERGLDRGLMEITTSSIEAYRYYAEGINLHERFLEAQAVPLFERAIALDPDFAMALSKLAVVSGNLGLTDERDEYARRALDQSDRLTTRERYYIEGFYYTQRPGTLERGIQAYEQGLALHPEHQAARHNLAAIYGDLGRTDESIAHYEELIRRGTSNPTAYGNLAIDHVRLGHLTRAREVAEEYVRQHPENASGYENLGQVLAAAALLDDAKAAFETAVALDPQNTAATDDLATVALLQERWADAQSILTDLAETTNPAQRVSSLQRQADLSLWGGNAAAALDLLDRTSRIAGASAAGRALSHVAQARILLATDRAAMALREAEAATREGGDRASGIRGLFVLAIVQSANGRQADAASVLDRLAELRAGLPPNTVSGRRGSYVEGRVALEAGNLPAAIEALRTAVDLLEPRGWITGSEHADYWYALARAYLEAGQDDDAAPWLEQLTGAGFERLSDPIAYVRAHYRLAQIRERQGDAARARDLYARFLDYWDDGDMNRDWVADARQKVGGS